MTITTWSSALLSNSFESRNAGFDVRAPARLLNSEPLGLVMGKLIRIDQFEWRPATIDSEVWPRVVDAGRLDQCNGVNLFPSLDQASEAAKESPDACIVAFEFPTDLLERISKTFGLSPGSGRLSGAAPNWELLGYDVVDIRTQSSGFYSFEWDRAEWIEMVGSDDLKLNSHGLLASEASAVAHSVKFDQRVPSHAPFAPCAIWRKN